VADAAGTRSYNGKYDVRIDPERLLVDVRMIGFLTPGMAGEVTAALRDAVRSLDPDAGRHVTLYDATALTALEGITVEQVAAAFADPAIRSLWARRVAWCTPSALVRMQILRLRSARSDISVFGTRAEALGWLFEGDVAERTGRTAGG